MPGRLRFRFAELYDLENDPGELRNLYRARPNLGVETSERAKAAKAELQENLYAWQRTIDDPLLAQMAKERDPAKR
ncbi:MAG: hypothetical protein Q7S40_11590 [Opitutaceae bacterium]|nr:hypothetical protein [Opitutaceae bacterium]